jgi:CHASE2 domain-containing sensor protein
MRAIKNRLGDRWAIGWIGAIVCVVATVVVRGMETSDPWRDGLRGLHAWSHDLLLQLRGRIPVDGAVVISMDDESYRALAQTPDSVWDRRLHAQFIRKALALGARAVVFDIWFADPAAEPALDRQLIDAITNSQGRVILAAKTRKSVQGDSKIPAVLSEVQPPTAAFANLATWGVVDLPVDGDKKVRRHHSNFPVVSLAWKTADSLGLAPEDPQAPRWINDYGPLRRKSYHEVLRENLLPPGYFSNQVLFVGGFPVATPTGTDRTDVHETPMTRGEGMAGVEIQAAAYLNLVRGDWLVRLPRAAELLVLMGSGLLIGLVLPLFRPWVSIWLAVLVACLFAGISLLMLWRFRISFPWLVVCGIQVPCAFLWSVIAQTKGLVREKADLQQQLATAIEAAERSGPARTPKVPNYSLIRRIGSGAYGDVWLARDLVGNFCAVKAVYRERFPRVEPFEREFHGIERFSSISRTHPGWVDILHIGRFGDDEGFFYIMEIGDDERHGPRIDAEHYVPRTLAGDLRRRRKLPLGECLDLAVALADALEHLHSHALIHRDVKPSNVIFVRGAPKFADLGLVTDVKSTKRDVTFIGTEGYIAPEGPGSPTADLFSLGKLIYEAATGRDCRAFPELPTALAQDDANPAFEELYRIILKSCEFEVRRRYASAAEVKAELNQVRQMLQVRG